MSILMYCSGNISYYNSMLFLQLFMLDIFVENGPIESVKEQHIFEKRYFFRQFTVNFDLLKNNMLFYCTL